MGGRRTTLRRSYLQGPARFLPEPTWPARQAAHVSGQWPRRRGAQAAQVHPRAVPRAPILRAAGAGRRAPARGGRGLGHERRGRPGARTELAGTRRGGGSPLPGGGGGGVAVALLSRGATASCGWSRLQRQLPVRLPHARTPARRGLALLAIFQPRSDAGRGGGGERRSRESAARAGPAGRSRP